MRKTYPGTDSRLRVAAYCRIDGGKEQSTAIDVQRVCYTERIGANRIRIYLQGGIEIEQELIK